VIGSGIVAVAVEGVERAWGLHAYWDELVSGTEGMDVAVGSMTARIAAVPLFAERDGGLRQAVRIHVPGDRSGDVLTASIHRGETELDGGTLALSGDSAALLLLVPEIESETPHLVRLSVANDNVEVDVPVAPQRKWTVDLIHHSHLDIGYTDPQAVVLDHQLAYLDAALDLVDATDDWPEDARFCWNVEATWPLRHWLARRPRREHERFFKRVREGRIEVCALPFTMHTEALSMDELARQLDFAVELRERHGIEVVSAMQTDVPGATLGLATLLTDAGVENLSVAHNFAGRSVPYLHDGQELRRPFWWEAPSGKRVLVWYTDTTMGSAYMEGNHVGLASGYTGALALLPEYLAALAGRAYPYGTRFGWAGPTPALTLTRVPDSLDVLHLRVQGSYADNAPPSLIPATITRAWNETWAYPRLRMATNRDFFQRVREGAAADIAVERGDWTDWWADGIGSAAIELGLNRRAQGTIRAAQTLHALADQVSDDAANVGDEVGRAYDAMALFDEHTWGASDPWGGDLEHVSSGARQWGRKAAFAHEAAERSDALLDHARSRLALFAAARGGGTGLLVVNPSSWPRTDLVRLFVPQERLPAGDRFAVRDAAGEDVPCLVEPREHPRFRTRGRWLTFLARGVPPLGYRRYSLAAGEPTPAPAAPLAPDEPLHSDGLDVSFDALRAVVTRITDRRTRRELVDATAPFGFAQVIYDRYATAPHFNHLSSRTRAYDMGLLGSRATAGFGVVTSRERNALLDRVTWRARLDGLDWVETTLTLPAVAARLDLSVRVKKKPVPEKESLYVAFPFAMEAPHLSWEVTGGVAGDHRPVVHGSARHFRAIRHWATLEEDGQPPVAWSTAEAPLVQRGTIHLPYAPFPSSLPPEWERPGTIFSWAMNNIWDTNFPHQQGGEAVFHYSVAVPSEDGGSGTDLGRTSAAALTAPLIGIVGPRTGAGSDGAEASATFAGIDHPAVEITHLAAARRGHDLAIYIQSMSDEPEDVPLAFGALPVRAAWLSDPWEQGLVPLAVADGRAVLRLPAFAFGVVVVDLDADRVGW
jgi:hypothetical protein